MDIAKFRTDFPEFADTTQYPDARVQFYLDLASISINSATWGNYYDYGVELFVAHNLLISERNISAGTGGFSPGGISGAATSKSVGGVSVSYDVGSVSIPGAGYWNSTNYGIQYYELFRRFGIGGIQL